MPLGEGFDEGMAATGKALHFNLEERTRDQGAFSPPSFNHGVLAIGLIVFPNCHDWEARRDEENRRVEHEAPPLVHFGPQRRDSLCADRQGIRGVVSLAPGHLELSDVGDVFNRCGIAQASKKARKGLTVVQQSGGTWRFADDESTGHGTKRLIPDQAANDRKTRDQDFDRACSRVVMGGKTAIRARRERRKRAWLEAPGAVLDICGRAQGPILQ